MSKFYENRLCPCPKSGENIYLQNISEREDQGKKQQIIHKTKKPIARIKRFKFRKRPHFSEDSPRSSYPT